MTPDFFRGPRALFTMALGALGYLVAGLLGAAGGAALGVLVELALRKRQMRPKDEETQPAERTKALWIIYLMLLIPLAYTTAMVISDMAKPKWLDAWLQSSSVVTDGMSHILPAIDKYQEQLRLFYSERGEFVRHMWAMNFALALPFGLLCLMLTLRTGRLCGVQKRAQRATTEGLKQENAGSPRFKTVASVFLFFAMCLWFSVFGPDIDFEHKRRGFHLQRGNWYFLFVVLSNWCLFMMSSLLVYWTTDRLKRRRNAK